MTYMLADIGGTHTRCALFEGNNEGIRAIQVLLNSEFDSPLTLLHRYLESLAAADQPKTGIFAIAAPITSDAVKMINIDWHFSVADLRDSLRLTRLTALNDFEALAYALPDLRPKQLMKVGAGAVVASKPKVVLGPGTGLGVAGLIPTGTGWQAIGGEGGHVTLAASNDREADLLRSVRNRIGHCSAERLVSGPGLSLIHTLLHGTEPLAPARLSELVAAGDPLAADTFEIFFQLLGTVASDLALTLGAFGGVYLGGGIIPRQLERFAQSGFRERFEDKGRYADYLRSIPTFVIIEDHPTLMGLAAYARNA
jgi:glucokinase